MGLLDGLASLEFRSTTVSGTTVQGTTVSGGTVGGAVAQFGASEIGNAELGANAASGTKVSPEFVIGYVGSPVAGNLAFQCGSADASDVSVNVVFPIPFGGNPLVVLTPIESGTNASQSYVGSSVTTGFIFWGQSGIMHSWIAVNNARV